ncbi:hypothetical protein LO772_21115 [Yinghuangia sp. ASG 101]|uniref:hypothetical protein n=1 Tax=Yinghuangia sp. ASG 101 TaxID=2896848 RepID=UPI001E5EF294|nr:hypothetical protein [Yinghuangia sp. ASG 101]UGQ09436.1 hypothetical protein LO772_21115 [Yinghuangia sp. ASG 101]
MPEHHHPGRTIEGSGGHGPAHEPPDGASDGPPDGPPEENGRIPARALPSGHVPQQGTGYDFFSPRLSPQPQQQQNGDPAPEARQVARTAETAARTPADPAPTPDEPSRAAEAPSPSTEIALPDPASARSAQTARLVPITTDDGPPAAGPSDASAPGGGDIPGPEASSGPSEAPGASDPSPSRALVPRTASAEAPAATDRKLPVATPAAVHGLLGLAVVAAVVALSGVLRPRVAGAVSWVAVDTIFTVAAFCLTAALTRVLRRDGVRALPAYYVRRVKQTLPWLAAVLLIVVACAYELSPLPEAREIRRAVFAGLLQVGNWEPLARSSEGAAIGVGPDVSGPLAGVWVLSVLGQFFLVWPLVLAALFLAAGRRAVPVAVIAFGGFAASAPLAAKLWEADDPAWTALGTHTRLVDLFAGATAALIAHEAAGRAGAGTADGEGSRARRGGVAAAVSACAVLAGVAALAASGWYAYRHPDGLLFDGRDVTVSAVVACAAAVTALALAPATGWLARAFGNQAGEEIGRMAYPVLLLFPPLAWLLRHGWSDISDGAVLGIGAGVTWLLALIVHYTGFRAGRRRWRGWPQRLVVVALVAAVGAGAYRLPTQIENELRPGGRPLVIGLGDGLAGDLAAGLNAGGERYAGVSGVGSGRADCGILAVPRIRDRTATEHDAPNCGDWARDWARELRDTEPDAVILHLGRDAAQPLLQGTWRTACSPEYRALYLELLDQALRVIETNTDNAAVVVLNERLDNSSADPIDTACYNQRVKEFADTHQGRVLPADFDAYLCASGACRIGVPGGRAFYTALDSHRLTRDGREFAAPWVEEQVAKAVAARSGGDEPGADPGANSERAPGSRA